MRRPRLLLLFLPLALFFAGCDREDWFDERMAEARSLSPASIAAFLVGGGFVSEDLTCISAGILVSKRSVGFPLAALACTLGVWASDSLLYFWGMLGRRGLLHRAPLRWIAKPERIERSSALFRRHGTKLLLLSRFLPGSRVTIYLVAGLLGYPYTKFASWMAVAAILWAPAMVWLSMKLGSALVGWLETYETITWIAVPAAVLLIWLAVCGVEWAVTRRSRMINP